MARRRFYIPPEMISQGKVVFPEGESHHAANVLRLGRGELVEVFDGQGGQYLCRITDLKPCVSAEIMGPIDARTESNLNLVLGQALIKADKFDLVVQKATELGVSRIHPLVTARTEVKLSQPLRAQKRLERWRRIAIEAAKQSRRSRVPLIGQIAALEDFVRCQIGLKLMLTEDQGMSFKRILRNRDASEIALLVGPEGGWDLTDLKQASEHGFIFVNLGRRILRSETAGLVALAIIQYELGDLAAVDPR